MSSLVGDGIIIGVLVVIAIVTYVIWDRRRYRGGGKGGNLQRTGELFRDPSSGKLTRVWEDPATGRREYREEPES